MKTALPVLLAICGLANAAPRLHLSDSSIKPGCEIEILLDKEAAPADRIGHIAATKWLETSPAWPGETVWIEANVLRFVPSESPKIGTTYTFNLVGKHVYLDGSEVPTGELGKASTTAPGVEYATLLERYRAGWSIRTARYYLRFNDSVDPTAAASNLIYQDKKGNQMAATVRAATLGELKNSSYIKPTFTQRFDEVITGKKAEQDLRRLDAVANGLIVEPAAPLPIGEEWYLVARQGLPIGSSTLSSDRRYRVGDVDPFQLQSTVARTVVNQPRRIVLDFNSNIPKDTNADMFKVEPDVPSKKIEIHGDEVHILGDFNIQDKWSITVSDALVSSDGLKLQKTEFKQCEFKHLAPSLAAASKDESQLASGTRAYRISTVNLDSVRVKIKQLKGTQLVRAQQGYRYYSGRGHDGKRLRPTHLIPYSMMSGATVADFEVKLDNPIDSSRNLWIDWDKVLAGDAQPYTIGDPKENELTNASEEPAAFFVEIECDPKSGARGKPKVVQSLVKLTDIGMGWKIAGDETQIFVFSCKTGLPMSGVKVILFGEDAERLSDTTTDDNGLASLPRDEKGSYFRAYHGNDQFCAPFDDGMPTVGLWRFPVRYSWNGDPVDQHRMMIFTDRSLYRPGEIVHVKGIVRRQVGNNIQSSGTGKVRLEIKNPTRTVIVDEELEISANGSIDYTFQLPQETVGWHSATIKWPEEGGHFGFSINVAEFRRNAFEISHDLDKPEPGASEVSLTATAKYYHGQAVNDGKVDVWTRVKERNFYPERYRDFLFGDHRKSDYGYWYYYFGYDWGSDSGGSASASSELELDKDGKVKVVADIPEIEFPRTRDVKIQTEVTDSNRQTLTKSTSTTVHPASVYVGVRRLDRLVRVGDSIPLSVIAVDTEGVSFTGQLDVTAELSREVNEQVRIRSDDGRSSVRNEKTQEDLSKSTLAFANGETAEYLFEPEKAGLHTLKLSGTDEQGRAFATAVAFHVYGAKEYPWAYEDNMRIQLVAEKKLYQPSDTARVLVLSPIEGKALVTIERETVSRSFVTDLDPSDPVIEIPLNDDDAPNCFVSVLVIKGAQDSQRKFKEPQLRLGYCELMVENQRDRLAVSIDKADGERASDEKPVGLGDFLPGSEVKIEGRVKLADGSPAAGAEVTVYAVDEGTLAVAGYTTPDPMDFFYDPRSLLVQCGTSLDNFIPEQFGDQVFFNKGFFIGGGDGYGGGEALNLTKRSDFDPCAFWEPAVMVDSEGRFAVTAKLPDTLTRYRLIAVANHGASKFGHAESDFKVNKPLMLEPQVPRFASEGDSLDMRAQVRNASDVSGTWKVTLVPNPPASEPIAILADGVNANQTVTLSAGESATVVFRVNFKNTGEAVMNWQAEPVSLSGQQLDPMIRRRHSDAVESVFQVEYPMPLLRQTRLIRLDNQPDPLDLLKGLDPNLLNGRGHIDVEVSRSLLMEAGGAIDYLLHYPYGCVEQTTSSLIPWLAVEDLRSVSPALAKHTTEEVQDAIQHGVHRLLSMQRSDGGFGYWPGASEPSPWSTSYATMGLIMASEQVMVPQAAIDRSTNYLVKTLRNLDQEHSAWEFEITARNLWVLAMAGKPQQPYVNLMRDRMDQLNSRARCFLALAEATSGRNEEARAILNSNVAVRVDSSSWMPWQPTSALDLLAWSAIDPGSDQAVRAVDKLLNDRNPYGHWRTTWVNAWSLIALAAYADTEKDLEPSTVTLTQSHGDPLVMDLSADNPIGSLSVPLHPDVKLQVASDGPAFIRIKLASKPEIAPMQPVAANGMQVTRFYKKVNADGTTESLAVPKVGDLIRVDLRVDLAKDDLRYLVIEDRLPANFEAVNNSFESQAANMNAGRTSENTWQVSHSEIRDERVMFFYDRIYTRGTATLSYLARCTLEGDSFAPPAKVESMYDPDNTALSASRSFDIE